MTLARCVFARVLLSVALLVVASCAAAIAASPAGPFDAYWSDSKAELDGYDLVQPRYSEDRHGRAVLVYVTEPFSRSRSVKVDRHDASDDDQLVVLKLNDIRKFQTGVYDYSLMTSVFTDPTTGFRPLVSRFSSQEWCGHVWDEVVVDGRELTVRTESYFDGETGVTELHMGKDVLIEDAIPVFLRGLHGEELATENWQGRLLESATRRRLGHRAPELVSASITWSDSVATAKVPAGSFEVREAELTRASGLSCRYQVERAYPHRIISWTCSDGERAQLTGSQRLPYWSKHAEGDEGLLDGMGLDPLGMAP